MIAARGLSKRYGTKRVIERLDLDVPRGSFVVVTGPNGSGKTTLLRLVAGLAAPTGGTLEVRADRAALGYLGHEPLLYRDLSVVENLELNARLHGIDRPRERIAELLGRAGLTRRGTELVRNLSAGMLQRAAICRALLHDPELLILDEPRAHLDVAAAEIVEEMLGPRPGRTRVVVTHEIERGLESADRVLALRADGTVAHAGPSPELAPAEARALYEGAVR